jgi:S1-C subfamily serine protease
VTLEGTRSGSSSRPGAAGKEHWMKTMDPAPPAEPGRTLSWIDHRHAAAAISVALHFAVVLAVVWPPAAAGSKNRNAEKGVEVRLIDDDGRLKPQAQTLAEHPPAKVQDGPRSTAALSKCDGRLYTGIGVRSLFNGAIVEVASGGPADKAGLRAGDTLLDADVLEPDQHKPGTAITLRILRDEREMPPVVAVVAEICDEQPRPGRHEQPPTTT